MHSDLFFGLTACVEPAEVFTVLGGRLSTSKIFRFLLFDWTVFNLPPSTVKTSAGPTKAVNPKKRSMCIEWAHTSEKISPHSLVTLCWVEYSRFGPKLNDCIPTIQVSCAENALTCECGEFDESTCASDEKNDQCYRLGVVLRTAEGVSVTGERFCMEKLLFAF